MRTISVAVAVAALFPVALAAQTPSVVTVFGEHSERGATRIAYWDDSGEEAIGELVIAHGKPLWKPEYDGQLDDMTRGRIWRLGENFWSWLDTNLPVEIGGVSISPGYYYLVVERSSDGASWRLGLVDPSRTRALHLDAYETTTRRASEIPIVLEVPLEFEASDETTERLSILLERGEESTTRAELVIRWGQFRLRAPVALGLP